MKVSVLENDDVKVGAGEAAEGREILVSVVHRLGVSREGAKEDW